MNILLGFDPGGAGKGAGEFGWCVAEHSRGLPLRIRCTGVAEHAKGAVEDALQQVPSSDSVLAAAIDAPLFWTAAGDRHADKIIRAELKAVGASVNSVMAVNALQGACLVQGMLAAMLLRDRYPALPLSESHPKAVLLLGGFAADVSPPRPIVLSDLGHLLGSDGRMVSEHERDAAVAALSAWAMIERPQGWTELYAQEPRPRSPLTQPLEYWIPRKDGLNRAAD